MRKLFFTLLLIMMAFSQSGYSAADSSSRSIDPELLNFLNEQFGKNFYYKVKHGGVELSFSFSTSSIAKVRIDTNNMKPDGHMGYYYVDDAKFLVNENEGEKQHWQNQGVEDSKFSEWILVRVNKNSTKKIFTAVEGQESGKDNFGGTFTAFNDPSEFKFLLRRLQNNPKQLAMLIDGVAEQIAFKKHKMKGDSSCCLLF